MNCYTTAHTHIVVNKCPLGAGVPAPRDQFVEGMFVPRVHYSSVQCSAVQCSAVQCSVVLCYMTYFSGRVGHFLDFFGPDRPFLGIYFGRGSAAVRVRRQTDRQQTSPQPFGRSW
jgi:hypothetical protein